MPDIYAAINQVRIYDAIESWNPIVLAAIKKGAQAVTLGGNQHYNAYPAPVDINRLPLIAHETIHSIDANHWGLGVFMLQYVGGSIGHSIHSGSGYRAIESEVTGWAVEATVRKFLLSDPVFKSAVQSGTISNLPADYPERILEEFQEQRAKIEAEFRRCWIPAPLGVP